MTAGRIKLINVSPGYAEVRVIIDNGPLYAHARLVGEVRFADEIANERGQVIAKPGWVAIPRSRSDHAQPSQFPRFTTRQAAAQALADGDVVA